MLGYLLSLITFLVVIGYGTSTLSECHSNSNPIVYDVSPVVYDCNPTLSNLELRFQSMVSELELDRANLEKEYNLKIFQTKLKNIDLILQLDKIIIEWENLHGPIEDYSYSGSELTDSESEATLPSFGFKKVSW